MPPFFTALIIFSVVTFLVTTIIGAVQGILSIKRLCLEISFLFSYTVALFAWTGFPHSIVAFSEPVSPRFLLALQISIIAGIIGCQAFEHPSDQKWRWQEILRPVLVAPMLLLPLLGSLDSCGGLNSLQSASFFLLAFQNGFFWRKVFHQVSTKQHNRNKA